MYREDPDSLTRQLARLEEEIVESELQLATTEAIHEAELSKKEDEIDRLNDQIVDLTDIVESLRASLHDAEMAVIGLISRIDGNTEHIVDTVTTARTELLEEAEEIIALIKEAHSS